MFKVGQKVVFIDDGNAKHNLCLLPKIGEIVTILNKCPVFSNAYDIVEYPRDKNGDLQSISGHRLRPLDDQFAESVLQKVCEEINKEQLTEVV